MFINSETICWAFNKIKKNLNWAGKRTDDTLWTARTSISLDNKSNNRITTECMSETVDNTYLQHRTTTAIIIMITITPIPPPIAPAMATEKYEIDFSLTN